MSQRNRYANSNLNGVLSSQKSAPGYSQPYSQPTRYGSGLVSLGSSKVGVGASSDLDKSRLAGWAQAFCASCDAGRQCGSSSPDQALRLPGLHASRTFTIYADLNAVSDLCCYSQKPASTSTSKLAVPKPVNLPSLRKVRAIICTGLSVSFLAVLARLDKWHLNWCVFGKQENSGNDPNVKIVPASGSGWEKIEEPAPAPPALARESHWATTQARDSGWRPVEVQALPPPRPGSRRLNPHEFPSLSAATAPRQLPKQLVPSIHDSQVLVLLGFHRCPVVLLVCTHFVLEEF